MPDPDTPVIYTGDYRKSGLRDADRKGLHRMNLVSFHSDLAVRSTTPLGCLFLLYSTTPLGCLLHIRPLGCLLRIGPLGYLLRTGPLGYLFAGKISADNGGTVLFDLLDSTFGDDRAALCTGFRPHLDEPVRLFQDLGVMVHQKDGIPVSHQVCGPRGPAAFAAVRRWTM